MKITVVGTGSFGTSLAMVLVDNNHDVRIYGRNEDVVKEINEKHTNNRYLKDVTLPDSIRAISNLEEGVSHAEILVLAVDHAPLVLRSPARP